MGLTTVQRYCAACDGEQLRVLPRDAMLAYSLYFILYLFYSYFL